MRSIAVNAERGGYRVVVGHGLIAGLSRMMTEDGIGHPRVAVSNTTVAPLWGDALDAGFGGVVRVDLPDGESHKSWPQVERLCRFWLENGVHRSDVVLALGGGVVTDLTGFAAAVYLRGLEWIAVPTTVLAMVDAAVGGKTGINLEQGKNLVGSFWAPRLVVADVATLETLPERELRAGLAEVVKAAWIADHDLLAAVERIRQPADRASAVDWEELVWRAVRVKARVVEDDEREAGARQALNLGHTLGHALESVTSYRRFLHGEAVAWGLLAAARLAVRRGLLSDSAHQRLIAAVAAVGQLPTIRDLSPENVLEHLARDKKRDRDGVAWVLPTDDGVNLGCRVRNDEVKTVFCELADRQPAAGVQ